MALNGSSSTIRRASCSSTRANSMRCIWPPDSVPIGAVLKAVEADGGERLRDLVARGLAHAAEKAGRAPQPGADEIEHRDREAAVDVGGLRQIGDVADVEAAELRSSPRAA